MLGLDRGLCLGLGVVDISPGLGPFSTTFKGRLGAFFARTVPFRRTELLELVGSSFVLVVFSGDVLASDFRRPAPKLQLLLGVGVSVLSFFFSDFAPAFVGELDREDDEYQDFGLSLVRDLLGDTETSEETVLLRGNGLLSGAAFFSGAGLELNIDESLEPRLDADGRLFISNGFGASCSGVEAPDEASDSSSSTEIGAAWLSSSVILRFNSSTVDSSNMVSLTWGIYE